MSKPTHSATDKVSLPNTFQPATKTFQPQRLLTETYQPVGATEVPTVIPQLVSGVAPASVAPAPAPVAPPAATGESK